MIEFNTWLHVFLCCLLHSISSTRLSPLWADPLQRGKKMLHVTELWVSLCLTTDLLCDLQTKSLIALELASCVKWESTSPLPALATWQGFHYANAPRALGTQSGSTSNAKDWITVLQVGPQATQKFYYGDLVYHFLMLSGNSLWTFWVSSMSTPLFHEKI